MMTVNAPLAGTPWYDVVLGEVPWGQQPVQRVATVRTSLRPADKDAVHCKITYSEKQ